MSKDVTFLIKNIWGVYINWKSQQKYFWKYTHSTFPLHTKYSQREEGKVDENKRAEGDTYFLECLTTIFVKFVFLDDFVAEVNISSLLYPSNWKFT